MAMEYRRNHAEEARALWELATGKPPVSADDRWGKFMDAVRDHSKAVATDALIRAECASGSFSPIPEDDMKDPFRRAFTLTKRGCVAAVEELRALVRSW